MNMIKDYKMSTISTVKSLSEFINQVNTCVKEIVKEPKLNVTWFRGEGSDKFNTPLVPGAFRKGHSVNHDLGKKQIYKEAYVLEPLLKASFSREAKMFFSRENIELNSWNEYFLMQHYGLDTRLLDWTESALNALAFSILDGNIQGENSVVWIFSPHDWNKAVTNFFLKGNGGVGAISFPQFDTKEDLFKKNDGLNIDELFRQYLKMDFDIDDNRVETSYYPLAIYPYLLDDRMRVQKSCFTVFGNEVSGLLDFPSHKQFLRKIVIDKDSIEELKFEMRLLGIELSSLYPDIEGVARSVKMKYST